MPFSAYTPKYTKLKPEAANTLSLMFQIFLEKNYRTPCDKRIGKVLQIFNRITEKFQFLMEIYTPD